MRGDAEKWKNLVTSRLTVPQKKRKIAYFENPDPKCAPTESEPKITELIEKAGSSIVELRKLLNLSEHDYIQEFDKMATNLDMSICKQKEELMYRSVLNVFNSLESSVEASVDRRFTLFTWPK